MITVEHDFDGTSVFIIDPTGEKEDVGLLFDDDGVWIRQWNDENQVFEVIAINEVMFEMIIRVHNLEEGTYLIERNTE